MLTQKRRGGQPGRSGIHGNQGRKGTSLRHLEAAIKAAVAMFAPGEVGDVRFDISPQYCAHCGAWGWEGFGATLWGLDFGTPGAEPLATVEIEPQTMRHSKKCSNQ